jgi:hypothetical protein
VNLNINQHQLPATKHGEEIGLGAYWLPVDMLFCWRFAHQETRAHSPDASPTLVFNSSLNFPGKFPHRVSFVFRQAGGREMGHCLIRVTPREFSLASSAVSD